MSNQLHICITEVISLTANEIGICERSDLNLRRKRKKILLGVTFLKTEYPKEKLHILS
jgi:hypothetical protein